MSEKYFKLYFRIFQTLNLISLQSNLLLAPLETYCRHSTRCKQKYDNKQTKSFNPPYSDDNAKESHSKCLSVGLGNTFNLVLLLDCITIGRTLSSIHQLISQTLSHRLDVAESSFTSLHITLADTYLHQWSRE